MGPIVKWRKGRTDNATDIQLGSDPCWSSRPCMTAFLLDLCIANPDQAAVSYYLYVDVFSSDSKTRHFNRAVDRFVHFGVTSSCLRQKLQPRDILRAGRKVFPSYLNLSHT